MVLEVAVSLTEGEESLSFINEDRTLSIYFYVSCDILLRYLGSEASRFMYL